MVQITSIVFFLLVLAALAYVLRWYMKRQGLGPMAGASASVISTVAIGPQHRVVTVEVGPEGARSWLVLGVTPQNINCLHVMPAGQKQPSRS